MKKYYKGYRDKCITSGCINDQAHRSGKCSTCRQMVCEKCRKVVKESMLTTGKRCSACKDVKTWVKSRAPSNDLIFS